jgi:hypothetical protein
MSLDKSKIAPEGWTHPEAVAQDVSILTSENEMVSTLHEPCRVNEQSARQDHTRGGAW